MRFTLLTSCLLLAALASINLSETAFADETVEGLGYSIRVPDGFRKELDTTEGDTNTSPFSPSTFGGLGGLGTPVTADMKVFLRGTRHEPLAAIVIVSGRTEEEQDGISAADLDEVRRELGMDADVLRTTVGAYEAAEIVVDLSAIPDAAAADIEGTMFILAVPTGDFAVMVMYMNMQPERVLEAHSEWQVLKLGLKVDPPLGWDDILFWGLIAAGGVFVCSMAWRAFKGASDHGPSESTVRDWGFEVDPYDPAAVTAESSRFDSEPRGAPAAAPAGLRSTFDRAPRPGGPRPPPKPKREIAPPTTAGGLRPTLPPSGQWSDTN